MHRLYVKDDITVFWDSEVCRHAKQCVGGAPQVFDITRRPWIDLSRGDSAQIWQAISKCPTGALGVTYNHGITVEFDEKEQRSIATINGEVIGECDSSADENGWVIYHTHVLPEYEGKSVAKRLVYCMIEAAERRKVNITATCSYAARILKRS